MYINRYTYEGGNPFLLPSLSHNITLGTTYKWVYLSAGYQYVKDAIISFSGAYSEDDPTIALINMINAPVWGIERSGFFNGREKWAKGFENQRV